MHVERVSTENSKKTRRKEVITSSSSKKEVCKGRTRREEKDGKSRVVERERERGHVDGDETREG